MEKPFKKLKGNRIYLLYPQEQKSDIIMSAEAKAAMMEERMKTLNKLTVYAVGDAVTDESIVEGAEVMVDISVMMRRPIVIDLGNGIEVISVNLLDISHIW